MLLVRMWENTIVPDRSQITLWSIACWKTKATDTHSEYVVHALPRREWFHERTSMQRYTYLACLVISCYLQVVTRENCSELHNNIVERTLIRCRELETVLNCTRFFVILPVC
jgi:hypothetical protein